MSLSFENGNEAIVKQWQLSQPLLILMISKTWAFLIICKVSHMKSNPVVTIKLTAGSELQII